ncbi:GntR family transcriptional regulator [Trinickia mobilis]|uniref:GntR family transcriptional regulator n=1 Tax=Trinickia mobilis TaxID=2816356 RepID=UPI001A8EE5A0|nr:FCD domain-containing protein [Trinickia mobilis]
MQICRPSESVSARIIRELKRHDIFDLFELRRSIEASAVQLAVARADFKDVRAPRKFWKDVIKNKARTPATELVIRDEEFHVGLVALSGNNEMVRALYGINARIHFVRWVDLEQRGHDAFAEHLEILDAIEARDVVDLPAQIRSKMAAIPCPPPMHIVTSAYRPPIRCSS